MASEEGLRAGEPERRPTLELSLEELAERVTKAIAAARFLVENGSILGMGALQDALEEFDR